MIRIAGAFVAITIAVTAVGCTREAPAPQPKAAEQADAKSGEVDASALDPGNYPTKPLPPMGNGGDRQHVAVLEANRIAEVVVGPWEVDPALIAPGQLGMAFGGTPIIFGTLNRVADKEVADAGRPGHISGFTSIRKGENKKLLTNTVLEMENPEAAKAAAHAMPQTLLDFASKYEFRQSTSVMPIPGHGDTFAVASTSKYPNEEGLLQRVNAFTARGPFVLMQSAETGGDIAEAVSLVAKTLDLQIPAIDSFTPTPPAELANLPRDPSGLLARALPVPPKGETFLNNATFGPRGMLHYESDPIAAGKVFRDAGVDVAVMADGIVYRARDNAAAKTLATEYTATSPATGTTPAEAVPNLPGATCSRIGDQNHVCTGAFDRDVFVVSGPRLNDVHQKAAAQYLILAAK